MPEADFSESYSQSFDIHRAISAAVQAGGDTPIALADIVKVVQAEQPTLLLTQAELQRAIIRAAADAGIEIWIGTDQARL